jgi:predicted MPP superfamily phosphohydrolase
MNNEIMFSLFQSAKILSYYDLHYDELFTDEQNKPDVKEKYKEKTPVLSYYIIKSLFFFHLDEYIRKCISINGYTINFNKGDHYKENMLEYCNIVKKLHNDPAFITALQKIQTWSITNSKNIPKPLKETLRMSLHELK